jgi:cyclin B
MLIASKYEEIYAPEVRDFVYITDKSYSKEEILKMEYKILSTLNFDILSVYPYTFLQRFHFITGCDMKSFYLSQFILEYSMLEYRMCEFSSSTRAAASLFVARKVLRIEPSWNKELVVVSNYQERDLKSCAKDLCNILEYAPKVTLKACQVKFSSLKFMEVSKIINSFK